MRQSPWRPGAQVRVEFDTVTDRALRGSLRDPLGLEAESTALIIASLKRANKARHTRRSQLHVALEHHLYV